MPPGRRLWTEDLRIPSGLILCEHSIGGEPWPCHGPGLSLTWPVPAAEVACCAHGLAYTLMLAGEGSRRCSFASRRRYVGLVSKRGNAFREILPCDAEQSEKPLAAALAGSWRGVKGRIRTRVSALCGRSASTFSHMSGIDERDKAYDRQHALDGP